MDYSKIGSRLKLVRERKGLSYEQIFEITKIQPSILKGIEEGSAPVSPVFLKGFIKSYARSLSLNPEEFFKKEEIENPQIKSEKKTSDKKQKYEDSKIKKSNLNYFWIVAGALIVFLIAYFNSGKKEIEKPGLALEEMKEDQDSILKEETEDLLAVVNEEAPEEEDLIEKPPSLFDQIKGSEFNEDLLIQSVEPLAIYFKVDQQSTITKNLKADTWFHIKAKKSIYLRFDERKDDVQVFYNGKQINIGEKPFFERTFQ